MKENKRKISDLKQLTSFIKMFICFTVFWLIIIFNTKNVFAVGGGSNIGTSAVEKVDAILFQNPSKGGSKTLYADSSALGYYHYGETELLAKYRSYYEKVNGTIKNQDDFINYCIEKGMKFGEELICFADCYIFEEYNRSIGNDGTANNGVVRPFSRKKVTGWLYLYCDSTRYDEWVANRLAIGDEFVPKLYNADGTASYITIFPAYYFYGAVSSIVRNTDGKVLSQIYDGTTNAEDTIKMAYEKGPKHDIGKFDGLYGSHDIALGLNEGGQVISKENAWVMNFLNGCVVENGYMTEGISYDSWHGYEVQWSQIKAGIDAVAAGAPDLNKYMDIAHISDKESPCRAFKTTTQTLGIDKLYSGYASSVNGFGMKKSITDWGTIVDVNKTVPKVSDLLGHKELTAENLGVYLAAKQTTGVPSNWVNMFNCSGTMRYVWSADLTRVMGSSTGFFPRDRDIEWNVSDYPLVVTNSAYKKNRTLKNYPDYGNQTYFSLSDENKMLSVITLIQDNPALGSKLIAVYRNGGRNAEGDIKDIVWLNALGEKDFEAWQKAVIYMGNYLYNSCTVSSCPSTGWSTIIGMVNNEAPLIMYNDLMVGICLVKAVPPAVEDLIVSNSYNKYRSSCATDVSYDPSARNVIDWMHGTSDALMTGVTTATSGGQGSIPKDLNKGTELDLTSSWNKYEINSFVGTGGATVKLGKDTNNVIKIDPNSALATQYDINSEKIVYNTFVFLGRNPEGSEETELLANDVKIAAFPLYNNFNVEQFDAATDNNFSARFAIQNACTDGTAKGAMNVYFSMFQSDYEPKIVFNLYNSNSTIYGSAFQVFCTPYAIQKIDKASLENYKKEDYPEFGSKAAGYAGLKPATASFVPANGSTPIEPGDVIAYNLQYKIPNSYTLNSEIRKNANIYNGSANRSLLKEGEWYSKYGAILMVDLSFEVLPNTSKATDEWEKINMNTNNDWVKMRIIPPVLNNIYFTSATASLDGDVVDNFQGAEKITEGIHYTLGRESHRETVFKLDSETFFNNNSGGTSEYTKGKAYLSVKWRYWCRGKNAVSTDPNTYNYLDYTNGFTHTSSDTSNYNNSSKIQGTITGIGAFTADVKANIPDPKLSVDLNNDILNSAKEKTITVSVPNNSSNQFKQDWEIVTLTLDVPDKDNVLVDLVLTSGGADIGQNVKRGSGDSSIAQQLSHEFSNCALYAVVRRDAPAKRWKETMKGSTSYIPSTGPMKLDMILNGIEIRGVHPSLVTESISGYSGRDIASFINQGDYILYKYYIPGEVKQLDAVANFRNTNESYYDYEDSTISNNSWQEKWEVTNCPDYELTMVDGVADLQVTSSDCGGQVNHPAWITFTVAQLNANYTGGREVKVHIYREDGKIPETVSGLSYMGNGVASVHFGSGASDIKYVNAHFGNEYFDYKIENSGNNTFEIFANINYDFKEDNTEINYSNNYKSHFYTVDANCKPLATTGTLTPCCVMGKLRNTSARTIYGLGRQYTWDTKFAWSQQNNNQYEGVNVYVTHYIDGCPSIYKDVPDGDGGSYSVLVQYITHMHCPCYCTVAHSGPNNDKRYWRNRELGLGLYYEYHDLRIFCRSSAHGLRDISGGTTQVFTGEAFEFYFDAIYNSNRGSMPNAKHEPWSQPYTTGQGGSGCHPCNILNRWPGLNDVAGPRMVRITISSNPGSNYDTDRIYYNPQHVLAAGAVNKHFRWKTFNDEIYVMLTNVNQTMHLAICSYDFTGYLYDTWESVDSTGYSMPGYAWDNRDKHVFCGTRTATIQILPSKAYIASNPGSGGFGLDSTSPSEGGPAWTDGDTWVQ